MRNRAKRAHFLSSLENCNRIKGIIQRLKHIHEHKFVTIRARMQQAMLQCNGIQTHVITEGRWVEEGLAPTGCKDLVIVIPGNPGVPSFYMAFIKALKSRLPPETPVWVVGHAGHVQPSDNLSFLPNTSSNKELYNLDGQVNHKVAFIKQYVPKDARIHLIGHSIGSWMILQLLKDPEFASRVVKCYLLFPTVERMAETPNGKFLTNVVLRIAKVLVFLAWIFSFFPSLLQVFLIQIFGIFLGITRESVKPVQQLLHPSVLERVFRLANDEMKRVKEIDHEAVVKHNDKLWFYYGATDRWTPHNYYRELKEKYPNINAQLCQLGFRHAFVLTHSKEVGHMVGDLIQENIANSS
ncbi:lipid droplet-associated hydrolase [Chelonus insularis]|uniref:lipid droplet-associated hydrolase n=1 Tax=Chelonus insularis TaxID=460826 RepID=UPI00158F4724|nr:lipid droplet-associated hydrolase [Chelonus insularis]